MTAVDVDPEVLVTAQQNLALNDNLDEKAELLHVREVSFRGPRCVKFLLLAQVLRKSP